MIKLFLHSFSYRFHYRHKEGFDVNSFIDQAVRRGFSGVNISAYGPEYRELSLGHPSHIARLRDRIEAEGLLIDIETNGTSPTRLRTYLELGAKLGATYLRIYTLHKGTPEERVANTVKDLKAALPIAEQCGMQILIENHEDISAAETASVVQQLDSPHIGVLYDYGNSMTIQEDPIAALDILLPWIRSAHLKDHLMLSAADTGYEEPVVLGVPFGEGRLPIVEITRRLEAAGVDRVVCENVWAYRTQVYGNRGGEALGSGVFEYGALNSDPAFHCMLPEVLAKKDPSRLVALEEGALDRSMAWLRPALQEAGIKTA